MKKAIVRTARFAWGSWAEPGSVPGTGDASTPIFPTDGSIEDWARLGGGLASTHPDLLSGHGGIVTDDRGTGYPGHVVPPSP
ncbi:MAG: hypothetical protein PGN34_01565 [Methylobacterium frigidaeris]